MVDTLLSKKPDKGLNIFDKVLPSIARFAARNFGENVIRPYYKNKLEDLGKLMEGDRD